MSIEAKAVLLNRFETLISDTVTANQSNDILRVLSEELDHYSLEQTQGADTEDDIYLEAFISAKEIEGRSPKTIERYRYVLSRFMLEAKVSTRQTTVYHLRRYISAQKQRGLSDTTLEGIREIFSSYYNWLHRESLIDTNPCANLGAIKCQKKIKYAYSDIDLEKLKMHCKTDRDRALIFFLLATGCRISEVCGLNRCDVNLQTLECKVLGKGNKERIVFIDEVTAMVLSEYLTKRKDNFPALFVGKGTQRLSPHGVRYMLHRIQSVSGIKTTVHPHRFRRTLATNLIRRGMPIQEVARILGHEKLDTTMKYVCMNDQDIRHSYSKYI